MVDLKKQVAFEKHEAQRCNCDYEDLKRHLDRVEALSGHRYTPTSPRSDSWIAWSAAWDARQSEIDELKVKLKKVESGEWLIVPKYPTEKIIDAGSEARHYTDGHVETMYKAMIEAAQGEGHE